MASQRYITLQALTQHINTVLQSGFGHTEFLVLATVNNLSYYPSKDYYFFELIEKSEETGAVIARMSASAFNRASIEIRKFEELTGQSFKNDLKLLISVQVDYHSVHGLKLNLIKIDPEYTLGSIERERRAVLEKLVHDNPEHVRIVNGEYITRNKSLQLPLAIKSLAIISSSNSAGFQDLMHSLTNNDFGYSFDYEYFFTGVQGEHNAGAMVAKLIEVFHKQHKYDAVVIVRGGGSSSDLFMFNSYELSRAVARFPIPVITGIGHQKNETIVDLMAFAYTKTPTKAAEFIIAYNHAFENKLRELERSIMIASREVLTRKSLALEKVAHTLIYAASNLLEQQRSYLNLQAKMIPSKSGAIIFKASSGLAALRLSLVSGLSINLLKRRNELSGLYEGINKGALLILKNNHSYLLHHQKILFLMSKEQTLKRGYALIKNKKELVIDSSSLQIQDQIEIELHDAILEASLTKITKII